jgi:hypothetical protein
VELEKTHLGGVTPAEPDKQAMMIRRKKVHTFVKTVNKYTLTPSLTLDTVGGITFALSDLVSGDQTSFQTLYDQYRIVEVQVQFLSLNPSATESPLYTVIDYDTGAGSAVSINALAEYSTLQITQGQFTTTRTLSPQARAPAYTGSTASQALNTPTSQWFDISLPSVSYYGVLYGIPANAASSATPTYQVTVRYVLQFRNVR